MPIDWVFAYNDYKNTKLFAYFAFLNCDQCILKRENYVGINQLLGNACRSRVRITFGVSATHLAISKHHSWRNITGIWATGVSILYQHGDHSFTDDLGGRMIDNGKGKQAIVIGGIPFSLGFILSGFVDTCPCCF